MITIKKYPNRRLYDTSRSKYVNLDYVKQLILDNEDFEVLESKTGDDVTKSMLLQIISESETNDQQSLLTNSLLKQLIRFYGGDMHVLLRDYLEQSLSYFLDQQDTMQGYMKNFVSATPINIFTKMMEQNIGAWPPMPQSKPDKE